MSVDQDTADEGDSIDDDQSDDFIWSVNADGMELRKTKRYGEYELVYEPLGFAVGFDSIDEEDGGVFKLKDGYDEKGEFDPEAHDVPDYIRTAFTILAHEI